MPGRFQLQPGIWRGPHQVAAAILGTRYQAVKFVGDRIKSSGINLRGNLSLDQVRQLVGLFPRELVELRPSDYKGLKRLKFYASHEFAFHLRTNSAHQAYYEFMDPKDQEDRVNPNNPRVGEVLDPVIMYRESNMLLGLPRSLFRQARQRVQTIAAELAGLRTDLSEIEATVQGIADGTFEPNLITAVVARRLMGKQFPYQEIVSDKNVDRWLGRSVRPSFYDLMNRTGDLSGVIARLEHMPADARINFAGREVGSADRIIQMNQVGENGVNPLTGFAAPFALVYANFDRMQFWPIESGAKVRGDGYVESIDFIPSFEGTPEAVAWQNINSAIWAALKEAGVIYDRGLGGIITHRFTQEAFSVPNPIISERDREIIDYNNIVREIYRILRAAVPERNFPTLRGSALNGSSFNQALFSGLDLIAANMTEVDLSQVTFRTEGYSTETSKELAPSQLNEAWFYPFAAELYPQGFDPAADGLMRPIGSLPQVA
ncbi:MAG: pentapeptide repeat-containing protein [Candidatus Margulisiibacteriota bacterium]